VTERGAPPSLPTRREVAVAGHAGDRATVIAGRASADPAVRATALGALERLGELTRGDLDEALRDEEPTVRRRAAELAAQHPDVALLDALADRDARVVEMAAWACGEQQRQIDDATLARLIELARSAADDLVREAAVAALGAIGDERAVDAIVAAVDDKPTVRRRAVLALAPFVGEQRAPVEDALQRALADKNWQVRQAAEDLLGR
jgi:HEAT repeat protein